MPFQSTVNLLQPAGFPGGWGAGNIWAAYSFIADEDVETGAFVTPRPGTDPAAVVPGTPDNADVPLLGIALRTRTGLIADPAAEASAIINAGLPVEVLTQGDAIVSLDNPDPAALAPGMAIFASLADGTPAAAAAGSTIAGSRETPWKFVRLLDPSGKTALVSTWRCA